MKGLQQTSVIGMGLLGASITLAVSRAIPNVKTVGYSHRPSTRKKARQLGVADAIVDSVEKCVADADIVILATPISIFEDLMSNIANHLKKGCIVTDVGSTKVLPHRWAAKYLPTGIHYVGSHPIAGSEKRGVEFARDDLFFAAKCILTKTNGTHAASFKKLKEFWAALGCFVEVMNPSRHDRIFSGVSHIPHIAAAAIVNASDSDEVKFAGKGFIDTTRVASGPANIWTDVLLTNSTNITKGIDRLTSQLAKVRKAVAKKDRKQVEKLLSDAAKKRAKLIEYKIKKNELL